MKKRTIKHFTGWIALNKDGSPFYEVCNPLIYIQPTKPDVWRGSTQLELVRVTLEYAPPKKKTKPLSNK